MLLVRVRLQTNICKDLQSSVLRLSRHVPVDKSAVDFEKKLERKIVKR